MNATPVAVFATFRPRAGKHDALRALLDGMVEHTRGEPGNDLYNVYRAGDGDDRTLHLFERYGSAAALQEHRDADYYKAYRAQLPDLLQQPVEVVVLDEVDVQSHA